MKWPLIFLLSLFGLVMGFGTIDSIPFAIEPFCWAFIFIVCAFVIAKYCTEKYFLNGLAVSIVNAIWMTIMHLVFFTAYTTNHTMEMRVIEKLVMPDEPQIVMFFTGIISGATSGLILGLLSYAAAKILHNDQQEVNALLM
jgi:hypothetical protein